MSPNRIYHHSPSAESGIAVSPGCSLAERADRVTCLPGGHHSSRAGQTLADRRHGDPAGTGDEEGGDSRQRLQGEKRLAPTPPAVRPLSSSSEQCLGFKAHSRVLPILTSPARARHYPKYPHLALCLQPHAKKLVVSPLLKQTLYFTLPLVPPLTHVR